MNRIVPLCLSFFLIPFFLDAGGARAAIPVTRALEEKPVLSVLLGSRSRLEAFADDLNLLPSERSELDSLVFAEKETLFELRMESREILHDETMSWEARRTKLQALNYNAQVEALVERSLTRLHALIGEERWARFVEKAEELWQEESRRGGRRIQWRNGVATVSYVVWATQYDAYTTDEVAVPDQYVKYAALGWEYNSGYPPDLDYRVTLYREGYEYTVDVLEVGPWNIDDNYWNSPNDPDRPRRMFTDLPVGTPESEAAYFNDYNDGQDQFGRTVANPGGVDMAVEVAPYLGLDYLENDWVEVTYLWEGGDTATLGDLVGFVREDDIYSGQGIAGATVTLDSGESTTTDADGFYAFRSLAVGTYRVSAQADCFESSSTTVAVEAGVETWASLALTAQPECGGGGGPSCRADVPLRGAGPGRSAPLLSSFILLASFSSLIALRRRM